MIVLDFNTSVSDVINEKITFINQNLNVNLNFIPYMSETIFTVSSRCADKLCLDQPATQFD